MSVIDNQNRSDRSNSVMHRMVAQNAERDGAGVGEGARRQGSEGKAFLNTPEHRHHRMRTAIFHPNPIGILMNGCGGGGE